MTSRRQFIRTSTLAAVAAAMGVPSAAHAEAILLREPRIGHLPRAGDPTLRALAMRALDAARAAGATYADVRLTVSRDQTFYYANPPMDNEEIVVGVRALKDGAWGFVSSVDWSEETVSRLGREAVAQAEANAWSGEPPIELGAVLSGTEGEWHMPAERDPFTIAIEEKLDYIRSAEAYAATFRNGGASSVIRFERQERTFASTENAFYTQTVYNTLGRSFFAVSVRDPVTNRAAGINARFVSPTGGGYEIFTNADLLGQIPQLYQLSREMLTSQPLEYPERFDVVFDGYAMANIVSGTLGAAFELDRALGYEANAGGTSWAAPPDTLLGSNVTPAAVTLTANRSAPGGVASVKWDDDGVPARDFTLIENGVAVDYSTNRELAGTLADWYQRRGLPAGSRGCALADDASTMPIVHTPNLELHPAKTDTSFNTLVSGVENGIAVLGGRVDMDQQHLNGQGTGELVYRIRKGKIVGTMHGVGYLIRTPEFWKDLAALGGTSTAVTRGVSAQKGQPQQNSAHTVKAVAAAFRNVRAIDLRALDPAAAGRESMGQGVMAR